MCWVRSFKRWEDVFLHVSSQLNSSRTCQKLKQFLSHQCQFSSNSEIWWIWMRWMYGPSLTCYHTVNQPLANIIHNIHKNILKREKNQKISKQNKQYSVAVIFQKNIVKIQKHMIYIWWWKWHEHVEISIFYAYQ